jgi:hypothetical protein
MDRSVQRARLLVLLFATGVLVAQVLLSGAAAGSPTSRTAVGAPSRPFVRTGPGDCLTGQELHLIGDQTLCSHGPDPAPTSTQVAASNQAASAVPAAYPDPPCAQDAGGYVNTYQRIRVMFGYPSDTTFDSSDLSRVRNYLRIADYYLAQRGGNQHYRFYCLVNSSNVAYIQIKVVKLLPIGSDGRFTYDDLTYSLYYQKAYNLGPVNYRNGYHDYAVFVDNIQNAYTYGGQSNVKDDSRWSPSQNQNNSTAYYKVSLINSNPAWGDYTAQTFMHETGHSLGAVQNDAPHASGGYHCYDEYDTMCYNDGGSYFANGGVLKYPTPCSANVPYQVEYFDCQRNDYYNANPTSGTYIYGHWNLANSYWLTPIA